MDLRRGVAPAMLAAMSSPLWHPVVLVEIEWADGPRRLHSATGTLTVNDTAYLGVGAFGDVAIPSEGLGLASAKATLSLYDATGGLLPDGLPTVRNKPAAIRLGALSAAGAGALIAPPLEIFAGYVDAVRFRLSVSSDQWLHALQIDLGSGPSARTAAQALHSAEDQARKQPGDTIMRHLLKITDRAATLRRA